LNGPALQARFDFSVVAIETLSPALFFEHENIYH